MRGQADRSNGVRPLGVETYVHSERDKWETERERNSMEKPARHDLILVQIALTWVLLTMECWLVGEGRYLKNFCHRPQLISPCHPDRRGGTAVCTGIEEVSRLSESALPPRPCQS
jgi:hypothetical protein